MAPQVVGLHNVVYVGEVARVAAVTVDDGRLIFMNDIVNFGMTAAYGPLGSCRLPKTLK